MEGKKGLFEGIREAYNKVRGEMRSTQSAHDQANVAGSAPLEVDGQKYEVTRDSAGRSIKPVDPEPPKEQPAS